MKRKLTPKQKVLRKYPFARRCLTCTAHEIRTGDSSDLWLGMTWADAARRLKP